jgi:hypothetical protein
MLVGMHAVSSPPSTAEFPKARELMVDMLLSLKGEDSREQFPVPAS